MPYWDHEKSSLFGCFFSWPQGASYSLGRELPKPFQRSLLRSIRSSETAEQPFSFRGPNDTEKSKVYIFLS